MPAKTYINDNGTWRTVRAIYVNDGTAWRTVREQWINDNGTWRKVFINGFVYDETISVNTSNYDLRTKLTNAGWNGSDDVIATININPAITVYSTTTPTAAFTVSPALPAGSTVTLINQGLIIGKAGKGGDSSTSGEPGGNALLVSSPIIINNTGGTIAGGGGGGGGGGSSRIYTSAPMGKQVNRAWASGGGGGGGGGSPLSVGLGGTAAPATLVNAPGPVTFSAGTPGSNGTTTGGARGLETSYTEPLYGTAISGAGGAGGNRGSAGATSVAGTGFASGPGSPIAIVVNGSAQSGGSAGAAISGNPFVTLPTPQLGTITGPRV